MGDRHKILVVEDDALVRKLSVRALLASGYHVDTAEDGAAGWDALQARIHDLLLSAQNMPKMSGIQLVKRARIARMSLPAVLVSRARPKVELEQYPWLKISAILAKPFSQQELLATVQVALSAAGNPSGLLSSSPPVDGWPSLQPRSWGINQ